MGFKKCRERTKIERQILTKSRGNFQIGRSPDNINNNYNTIINNNYNALHYHCPTFGKAAIITIVPNYNKKKDFHYLTRELKNNAYFMEMWSINVDGNLQNTK